MGTNAEQACEGLSVLETATARWLSVPEIIHLLSPPPGWSELSDEGGSDDALAHPLRISRSPPQSPPPSGTLLLYDRSVTRNYKSDGYNWIKKKNSPNKVREDHVKLRAGGRYRVAGCYVHSANNQTLHRRAYHLLDQDDDPQNGSTPACSTGARPTTKSSLVLLHYLDTREASEVSARLADRLAASASSQYRRTKAKAKGSKTNGKRPVKRRGSGSDILPPRGSAMPLSHVEPDRTLSQPHQPADSPIPSPTPQQQYYQQHQQHQQHLQHQNQHQHEHQQHQQHQHQQHQQHYQQNYQEQYTQHHTQDVPHHTQDVPHHTQHQRHQQQPHQQQTHTYTQHQHQQQNYAHNQHQHQQQSHTHDQHQQQHAHHYQHQQPTQQQQRPQHNHHHRNHNHQQQHETGLRQCGVVPTHTSSAGHSHEDTLAMGTLPISPGYNDTPPQQQRNIFRREQDVRSNSSNQSRSVVQQLHHHDHQQANQHGKVYDFKAGKTAKNDQQQTFEWSCATDTPKHHRVGTSSVSSFDGETLDILWNMVMDDVPEELDNVEELQEAAATAIQQHLTPFMEEKLANTVEQAIQDAANTAMEQHNLTSSTNDESKSSEQQVELSVLEQKIAPGIEEEVVQTLDQNLPPALEQRLVATMEKELYRGSSGDNLNSGSGRGASAPNECDKKPAILSESRREPSTSSYGYRYNAEQPHQMHCQGQQQPQETEALHDNTHLNRQHRHCQQENEESSSDMQGSDHDMKSDDSSSRQDYPYISRDHNYQAMESEMNKQTATPRFAPPSPSESGSESVPVPTPLPEVVDFTPSDTDMASTRKTFMVISTSAPVPELPPDGPNYHWQPLVAFIDMNTTTDSTRVKMLSADAVVRNVALTTVRKLTPFSYKCQVPDIGAAGRRCVILVGVRLAKGADPICEALCAAVTLSLQAEWNASLDYTSEHVTIGQMARPSFYAPAGGENVQLLSQMGQDFFEFFKDTTNQAVVTPVPSGNLSDVQGSSPTPKAAPSAVIVVSDSEGGPTPPAMNIECAKSVCSSATKGSLVGAGDLPAPAAAMASIAKALIQFPDPPAEAVDPQESDLVDGDAESMRKDLEEMKESTSKPKRKRIPSLAADVAGELAKSATEWATAPASGDADTTLGDSVNRHCKIRFVERLANVIDGNKTEETINLTGTSQSTTAEGKTESGDGGLDFLNDEQLQDIEEEELDTVLDKALIRFVESMLEESDSEELKDELNAPDFSGFTLLHYASLYNFKTLLPLLLSRGADPDIRTVRGKLTPLHLACGAGHEVVIEHLVKNGATIDVQDSFGQTPLDHALCNGFLEVAKVLLQGDVMDTEPDASTTQVKREGEKATTFYSDGDDLMRSAFTKLSLKDKLGLNFFVRKYKRSLAASESLRADTIPEEMDQEGESSDADLVQSPSSLLPSPSNGSDVVETTENKPLPPPASAKSSPAVGRKAGHERKNSDEVSLDDCSFISEADQENLDVAMSLMSKAELQDLEKNAAYSDVRKWMLRSNYESLREASLQLQRRSRLEKGHKQTGKVGKDEKAGRTQKQDGKLLKKNKTEEASGNEIKHVPAQRRGSLDSDKLSQALAMLVIRKNLLASGKQKTAAAGAKR